MKKTFGFSLIGLWVLFATGFLARWWLTHPDAIPRFPKPFWIWLIDLYGSQNGEELADLEMWVALSLSFVIVALLTLIGWFLWRYISTRANKSFQRTR